jgi:transcriptional regulator with XRE-family HTH domain
MARGPSARSAPRIRCDPLRLARGLGQEALAADAGLHQGLICEIENEVSNPGLDTLGRLATALGARPRDLFEE